MMEEPLECGSVLSLKQMAQRRVLVHLFCDSDILAPISIFQHDTREIRGIKEEWQRTIETKVNDKVLALNLPKSLTKQMIEMARPIGLQIKRWNSRLDHHFRNETEEIVLPDSSKLRWTAAGLIDYRKTAKELVCCDDSDVVLRYKLACFYCLEEDIHLLWEKLTEEKKSYFSRTVRDQKRPLYFCWPHILEDRLWFLDHLWRESHLTSFHQWAFEESAGNGNKVATEYFFQKLTPAERGHSLIRTAVDVHRKKSGGGNDELCEVFFYLLSVMTRGERAEILEGRPMWPLWPYRREGVPMKLSCFLYSIGPDFLLENARNFWSLIPPRCYDEVYNNMFQRYVKLDPYHSKMSQELFRRSPPDFKKRFFKLECHYLRSFLEIGDFEGIRAIFRKVDAPNRARLVFEPLILYTFERSILGDKWRALEVCLREAMLSKDRWQIVKEIFRERFEYFEESEKLKLERFFERIDGTDASSYQKKMAEKHKLMGCVILIKKLRPLPGDGESVSLRDFEKNQFLS